MDKGLDGSAGGLTDAKRVPGMEERETVVYPVRIDLICCGQIPRIKQRWMEYMVYECLNCGEERIEQRPYPRIEYREYIAITANEVSAAKPQQDPPAEEKGKT